MVKLVKFGMRGGGVVAEYIWGIFDLLQFKVTLGSFGALFPKILKTRKVLTLQRNGLKFGTRGVVLGYIWCPFHFILFKAILGFIRSTRLNLTTAGHRPKWTEICDSASAGRTCIRYL